MAFSVGIGFAGMLCIIEYQNVAGWSFSGYYARILRHIASPVDLSLVIYLYFDLNLPADRAEAPELSLLIVVMRRVELRVLVGQLDAGDQQMVLFVGGVRTQNQAVYRVVFTLWSCNVRQPLRSQRRPLERVRHNKIVQKRSVLFPYFILFVYNALLDRVVERF